MSFSFLKPQLIDIFKRIFDVSAIRVSLEFSRVTENENASLEFMVHVKSSNYDETQKIENITKDVNFTTLIQNETRGSHNSNLVVKEAFFLKRQPYLGTFIHSSNTRTPIANLNISIVRCYRIIIKLFIELRNLNCRQC